MPPVVPPIRVAVTGFLALALAMGVGRFAFTPFLPMMRTENLLTIEHGGIIAGVHFLGYWMGAITAARTGLSPRLALRIALFCIGVGTIAMGWVENLYAQSALRWLCGVASAWVLVLVSTYFVRYLARQGSAWSQGFVYSGVGGGIAIVGIACLAFMATTTTSIAGWQIVGGAALLVALILPFGPELSQTVAPPPTGGQSTARRHWLIILAYGAAGLGYIVPATYLPVMARAVVSDPMIFGWSWPIFGAAAAVSTLIAIGLQRHVSDRHIWIGSQVLMAAGVLFPVLVSGIAGIVSAGTLVGGTFMIITMVGMREAHRLASPSAVRHLVVALTAAFATGQMIGPVLASVLYDWFESFDQMLVLTGGLLLLSVVLLRERKSVSVPDFSVICPNSK